MVFRVLLPLVVVLLVLAVVYVTSARHAGGSERLRTARSRVKAVVDVAYAHDEISEALAGAVIDRTRGINDDTSAPALEAVLEDVLALARAHRTTEPDLAVILIDTARRDDGPRQLG